MPQVWQAILSKRIDMEAPELRNVSTAAKDLLQGLLERDPERRLTPRQALDHPWIRVRLCLQTDCIRAALDMSTHQHTLERAPAGQQSTSACECTKAAFCAHDNAPLQRVALV